MPWDGPVADTVAAIGAARSLCGDTYDYRLLIIAVEPVHQKTGSEVHVRPLFFRVPDQYVCGQARHRLS